MAPARSSMAAARRRDHALRSPLYHQVYVALRHWIGDGTYPPGSRIPTEPELCRAFGVSRITVRRAVAELVRQGALARRQGSGTFVRTPGQPPPDAASELSRRVAGLGASTGLRDLAVEWVEADPATREALALPAGGRVQRSTRVRTRGGQPIGYVTVWLPEAVGRRVDPAALRRSTALEALEAAGFRPAEVEERIGVTLAGVEAAARLRIAVGEPLLRVARVVRNEAGRPIERVLALWRADAYEHAVTARRNPPACGRWLAE